MDTTVSESTFRVVHNMTASELAAYKTIIQREMQDQDPASAEGEIATAIWNAIQNK
ncbi:MAG TPA: hypothetical protein VIY48_07945 [Candidatus Paceibacterota bacterium]